MDMRSLNVSSLWSLPAKRQEKSTQFVKEQLAFFDELYQENYPRVLAFLRFRTGIPDVAEDLTSQVFERALMHLAELRDADAAGPWLFRIARNGVADYFRHRRPELSLDRLDSDQHPCTDSPEDRMLAGEERRTLLTLVERLPVREREIIGLKFVGQLKNCEIAHVLGMPEGTVSSLLYRVLGRLRDALKVEGDGNEV